MNWSCKSFLETKLSSKPRGAPKANKKGLRLCKLMKVDAVGSNSVQISLNLSFIS